MPHRSAGAVRAVRHRATFPRGRPNVTRTPDSADSAHRRMRLGRIGRLLWTAPVTLIGLMFALPVRLFQGNWRRVGGRTGALLVQGPLADWLLSRHPAGAMNAMAIGHVIVSTRSCLSARLLRHELEHVRQAERWGLLFPLLYLASSGWQLVRGREAYWHNHFEIAARAAEQVEREEAEA